MSNQIKILKKNKHIRLYISIAMIVLSSFLQCYILQVFMTPCDLLAGGFTGLSILANKILNLIHINFPISLGIILFNVPAAMLCAKSISKRFTMLSCLNFGLNSLFLEIFNFTPFFDDHTLNVLFGGFLWGFAISLALRAGGSSGGTDFIAQYVSNKINKSIWDYVFAFNCCMLILFGYLFGWVNAGYSIVFQFLSTKTISAFYKRYSQITIEITTQKPEEVSQAFFDVCNHGMSIFEGTGGYSHQKVYMCKAIVSTYEVNDVIESVFQADHHIIVNTYHTLNFYGNFKQKPIE